MWTSTSLRHSLSYTLLDSPALPGHLGSPCSPCAAIALLGEGRANILGSRWWFFPVTWGHSLSSPRTGSRENGQCGLTKVSLRKPDTAPLRRCALINAHDCGRVAVCPLRYAHNSCLLLRAEAWSCFLARAQWIWVSARTAFCWKQESLSVPQWLC